jgi:hypothetical protein
MVKETDRQSLQSKENGCGLVAKCGKIMAPRNNYYY